MARRLLGILGAIVDGWQEQERVEIDSTGLEKGDAFGGYAIQRSLLEAEGVAT